MFDRQILLQKIIKLISKFYEFHYNDIIQFYTYNTRNAAYAGYKIMDNIIVAVDDLLYFVNSSTF